MRRGITMLEVAVTAALLISVTLFVVPKLTSSGPNTQAAKSTLVATVTAAHTLEASQAAWSEDLSSLGDLTARIAWVGSASSTTTNEVSYAVAGDVAGFAVSAGDGQCWLSRQSRDAARTRLYAVTDNNAVACNSATAIALDPDAAPPGRGEEMSRPWEYTP